MAKFLKQNKLSTSVAKIFVNITSILKQSQAFLDSTTTEFHLIADFQV
jgi:hypothetical protein